MPGLLETPDGIVYKLPICAVLRVRSTTVTPNDNIKLRSRAPQHEFQSTTRTPCNVARSTSVLRGIMHLASTGFHTSGMR